MGYICNNLKEVEAVTLNLNRASIVPLQINDNGVIKDINNFKGIYNNSTGELCNIAGQYYQLVQHKEYIDNFALALDRLGMKYIMDIKPSYNKIYVDIQFPEKTHKFEKLNEEFITGIRLINSYNKSTGLGIMPRLTRLACTNGMILTRNETTFNIKHTSKLLAEIERFIETRINLIINQYSDLQLYVSNSMKDSIEWLNICKITEKLFVQIKHREEVLKRLNITVIQNKEKDKKKVISYVNDDKNKKRKITRWDLYNAMTSYLTHSEQITPFLETYYQHKAEKVLTQPLQTLLVIK